MALVERDSAKAVERPANTYPIAEFPEDYQALRVERPGRIPIPSRSSYVPEVLANREQGR